MVVPGAGEGTLWRYVGGGEFEAVSAFGPRIVAMWHETEQAYHPQMPQDGRSGVPGCDAPALICSRVGGAALGDAGAAGLEDETPPRSLNSRDAEHGQTVRGPFATHPGAGDPDADHCGAQRPDDEGAGGGSNARRAGRRACTRVRRFSKRNRLTRLWTFTYREAAPDRASVVRDWHRFVRRFRERYGRVPWLEVIERGELGQLHVHWGADRWYPDEALAALWGRGFVAARLIRVRRKAGRTAAGQVAAYLAKYVSKAPIAGPGEHRYEVAEGFAPEVEHVWGSTRDEVLARMSGLMGRAPAFVSESVGWAEYRGPPAAAVFW